MSDELVGFEAMKSEYANDSYFGSIDAIPSIQYHAGLYSIEDFLLIDGFFLRVLSFVFPLDQGNKIL